MDNQETLHSGLDIASPRNTPVIAVNDGKLSVQKILFYW